MTGVYNRAYLDQVLAREFEHSTRHKWPLSVAFADLDNFKSINDRFGHQAGDRILQATARILRGNTRETDLIARYGGEEFVVVLPATDADTARSICERIVAAFQNTGHRHRFRPRHRDDFDRLRHPRQRKSPLPMSPISSRPPTKLFTPRSCAAATAPCPSTGSFPACSRIHRRGRRPPMSEGTARASLARSGTLSRRPAH